MAAYVIFDVESSSLAACAQFHIGPVYQGRKAVRDACSFLARLVAVDGLQS